jgi:tRNA uridine 5-carbamoylmethylation protein Kti12
MRDDINDINANFEQGVETAQKDPFNFPVPGHALTDEPNQWNWDKPPRVTDPEQAITEVINKVESRPPVKEHFLRLMAGGVSVEEIVNTIGLGGFVEGEWTPDTAELIKPALAVYFIGTAIKNKVPVIAFSSEQLKEENQMVSKADTLTMMKEKNPKEFNKVKSAMLMKRPAVNEPIGQEGFMNMEEV